MLKNIGLALILLAVQPPALAAEDKPAPAASQPEKAGQAIEGRTLPRAFSRLPRWEAQPLKPASRLYFSAEDKRKADSPAMPAAPPQTASAPPIADNSFLIEEAYNQEYGVVQHISGFQRGFQTDDWEYSFTQEWPFNPAPKSQLSYTISGLSSGVPGAGGGIGDTLLNYRYQAVSGERAAFAPRASLLLPSGSSRRARGAGGVGMEFNLPLSVQVARKLVTHWNAGATIVPRAKNLLGETATTYGYFLGASFIHQTHPRFNLMLETLFDSSQSVIAQDRAAFENSMIVNPGFRWAHNFESGLQIVPGIAFPVEVARAGRGNWGIFLYLSFEHPFGRRAP